MITAMPHVCLLVEEYDEAIEWYRGLLGARVLSDLPGDDGYRWVTLGFGPGPGTSIVLHKPDRYRRHRVIPTSPDEPLLVFATDDCFAEVERLRGRGVEILREPVELRGGVQAMFRDLCGNLMVLAENRGPRGVAADPGR